MRRLSTFAFLTLIFNFFTGTLSSQDLLISGVIDGPLTGGIPKAVEFYVVNDIADMSQYGYGSANNGGGSDGEEFTFPSVSAAAGEFIYCATESTGFQSFFGFEPDYTTFASSINGDDAIELFYLGSVIDIFGDINVDGTGTPWDYLDGWAYRINETGPDGSTFELANWTFSGPDALDGETSNATAAFPFPIGTYVYQPGQDLLISGVIDGPLTGGIPKAMEFYVLNDIADLSQYGFGSANNGGGSDGEEFTFPAVSATAGEFIYCATEAVGFLSFFGFEPDYVAAAAASINGDDAIELFYQGSVIDVFGDINVDGSGQPWEYLDGWAYRINETGPDGSTFILANWKFSGPNALDGETSNTTASIPFPTGSYTDEITVGPPLTLIHDIQGNGMESPMTGTLVLVEGIVVADFQDTNIGGFFVQEEDADADADPATSEGLFVYSAIPVSVGDLVQVTGTVTEFYTLTELSGVTGITIVAAGEPLPTPATVELPFTEETFPERYEGMSVYCPQTLTVSETYNLGRYGEIVLSNGRLYIPTNVVDPGPEAIAMQAQNDLNRILLDDGNTLQNVDPIVFGLNGNPLTADNTLRSGDQVTGFNGVLTYSYSGSFGTDAYRIHATETVNFTEANPRTAIPADVGGSLKVASFNVLNYFNGDGLGGGFPTSRGADDLEEFYRQRDKIIAAIDIMNADIIGLMEIENDGYGVYSAIQDLVNGLNAYTSGNSYAFIDPGISQIGTDEIAVGIIYRPETVTPLGASQILDNTVDPTFNSEANRPCLAQAFTEIASAGIATVAVNHLKSKGSECPGDPDTGDGQGNCNLTRTAAAEAIVNWLDTDPTGSGVENYLIIGDLNSYAMEDPVTAIKNGGYTDLIDLYGTNAYSYVFFGQAGYIDHALASSNILQYVTGTTVWHINTDEPRVLDYDMDFKTLNQHIILYNPDQYRSSDHDPVIVGLALEAAFQAVDFDVKPAGWPNPINTKSKGVTPVAILGTEEFDVSTIDVGSIYLDLPEGIASPVSYGYEDVTQPAGTAWECNDTENGADGYMDLTLKFNTQELVEGLGEVNDGDELVITIKGSTFDGPDLVGDDCILILKKGNGGLKSTAIGISSFSLGQNYPNPCNSSTLIPFEIPDASHVTLKVFDILGNEVAVLTDNYFDAGSHSVEFNAGKLAGGMYFYTIRTAEYTATRQMLVNE